MSVHSLTMPAAAQAAVPAPFAAAIAAALKRSCASAVVWGRDDCLMWLADIYLEATGVDPAGPWRGRYASRAGALRLLGAGGVRAAVHDAARRMGWQPVAPDQAEAGALGLIETEDGPAGVIFDGRIWVGRVDYGFSGWHGALVAEAWSVPCRK